MKHNKPSFFLMLMIVLLFWDHQAFAKISLQIDPPQVQVDETFRLIFTIDGQQENSIPELIPLQQDFTIVGTQRSMSYSIVNGQAHSVNQWIILLTPKKTGTIPIPSIRIGQQYSKARTVEVGGVRSTPDDKATEPQDDVLLKTEVSEASPYVNQQVIYTVKLFNSQRLLDAEYQPPRVEDALLIPLGSGRRYQSSIRGQNYAVEEQRYAISPQKSGPLKIIAPTFKALVYDMVPRRIHVHPKAVMLQVKPIPKNFKGKQWLPSKQVGLTEIYNQTDSTMSEGSTLVRTVTLDAHGIPAQLLPVIDFVDNPDFSVYKEQPDLQNKAKQGELLGIETLKVTYLLNKAGRITIPAIRVPWFNTTTGKEEIAVLPERTIDVTAKDGVKHTTVVPTKPSTSHESMLDNKVQQSSPNLSEKTNELAWWVAGGFALAWILTLVLWWYRRQGRVIKGQAKRQALKQLRIACVSHAPHQAQIALLRWANLQWPDAALLNLGQLATLTQDDALQQQVLILSEALYTREKRSQWQGDALWRCILTFQKATVKPVVKKTKPSLPPIHPGL